MYLFLITSSEVLNQGWPSTAYDSAKSNTAGQHHKYICAIYLFFFSYVSLNKIVWYGKHIAARKENLLYRKNHRCDINLFVRDHNKK